MKANVQNPIQSLHAFWCHDYRGRCAALPLIFPIIILLAVALVPVSVSAGQNDTSGDNEKRLDLLFDRIMETLPDQERSRVDSAATVSVQRKNHPSSSASLNDHPGESESVHTRLQELELPDELKIQVERAIADMEKRKEERKAQFRESRERKGQ